MCSYCSIRNLSYAVESWVARALAGTRGCDLRDGKLSREGRCESRQQI